VGDRLARRLVPRDDEEQKHRVELALGQLFAVDLGVDELADEVVGRHTTPLGREAVAVVEELERSGATERQQPVAVAFRAVVKDVGELRIRVADHAVAPVDQPVVVLFAGAEQPGEDADRKLLGDLLDEVEFSERQCSVEDLGRKLPKGDLVGLHRPRREGWAYEPP
jgi:hypothetical protein